MISLSVRLLNIYNTGIQLLFQNLSYTDLQK